MDLRPPEPEDLEQIVAIYNDVMASTYAIWREAPTSLAERAAWLESVRGLDHPALVSVEGTRVLGFAAAGPFRPWPGYAASWEHSIHVAPDARGEGVGGTLLAELERALQARGAHVMVAGIDAENVGSLRFHARAGFVETARMPEVGRLRDSWRDLVLVQKILTPATG